MGKCSRPPNEVILTSILGGLLLENRVPAGSIVTAGAQMGRWACFWAAVGGERRVWALDPDPGHIAAIRQTYTPDVYPTLWPMHGALGASERNISGFSRAGRAGLSLYPATSANASRSPFKIFTLDRLFEREALGFIHLDVEGHELEALTGGLAVLQRDVTTSRLKTSLRLAAALPHMPRRLRPPGPRLGVQRPLAC